MMTNYEGMWLGGGFMWIFWILLIVIVIWAVKAATTEARSSDTKASEDSALEILKKRYAKGEIDEKEFERKSKQL